MRQDELSPKPDVPRDEDALAAVFDAAVAELYPRLASTVYLMVRDATAAEDIVQDALLATWRQRHHIDLPDGLAAYLFQSCRNRALNHVRNSRRASRTVIDDPALAANIAGTSPSIDQQMAAADLQRSLVEALSTLAPGAREVFLLSRERGLTYNEIARLLDVSVKTVETQMSRALRALRQQLHPWRE